MPLAQEDVHGHHENEAEGETEGGEIGVAALGSLGNQFFHNDIHHGSCGERQQVGQGHAQQGGQEDDGHGTQGLYHAAEATDGEGAPTGVALGMHGHGDDGPLGDVLDGDTDGHGEGGAERKSLSLSGKDDADGHALGEVVDGDSQSQHGGAREPGARALGFLGAQMEVWRQFVDEQEEEYAGHEAHGGGEDALRGHLDARNKQRPDAGGHHNAAGGAQQGLLQAVGDILFHEEYECRPQHGSRQGEEYSDEDDVVHSRQISFF